MSERLLPWRGTIVQLAMIGALLYYARIAPEMHTAIMGVFAGLATLLTQRARSQAVNGDGGQGGGTGTSLYPTSLPPPKVPPPPPHSPKYDVAVFMAALSWCAAILFFFATRR